MRGFGIDASVPVDVACDVAAMVSAKRYTSFWVNGSPHEGALEILEAAAEIVDLPLGVGVFPLPKISARELVTEIRRRGIPQDRLLLGVGSGRSPGALSEVREAVAIFRSELDVTVVTGAVGPKMTSLAGEISDGVIFTWSIAAEIMASRSILDEAAGTANRPSPTVISFVRCALLPEARHAVDERATAYGAIPHYKAVFERHGLEAVETVVTGRNRNELLPGIESEEAVLDMSVIRAIPSANTTDAIGRLVAACAP
ncbi:MAG: hypothetical protein WBM90_13875 [Acidimicrobiia bacterium]